MKTQLFCLISFWVTFFGKYQTRETGCDICKSTSTVMRIALGKSHNVCGTSYCLRLKIYLNWSSTQIMHIIQQTCQQLDNPNMSMSLSRYHYLRGLVNTVSNRRLDALEDFQSLYKTDSDIFPSQMVKSLVDSLPEAERLQVSTGQDEWRRGFLLC